MDLGRLWDWLKAFLLRRVFDMPKIDSIELTQEQLRAMQLKSLEMFEYLKRFCTEHGLLVYLCGGCCIGALRHKGFIPWDDDVDVMMPRKDYEKLAELWPQYAAIDRYSYVRTSEDMVTGDLMAKICDNSTTCVTVYQQDKDIPQGLTLDIIPLDGCPSNPLARRTQKMWALIFSLFCAQSVPEKHGGLMAWGSKILLSLFRSNRIRYKIWSFAEKQMTKHRIEDCSLITELCSGPGYMKNEYPADIFAGAVLMDFEGRKEPLPQGYDQYLRIAFGDYMEMPPENKRKPHHDVALLDLNEPYATYKGTGYAC